MARAFRAKIQIVAVLKQKWRDGGNIECCSLQYFGSCGGTP